jgi:hypothetical protein
VLHSEKAIRVNRKIMRAFVAIRQYALNYAELKQELDEYIRKNDANIDKIFDVLDVLINKKIEQEKPRKPIGYILKGTNK